MDMAMKSDSIMWNILLPLINSLGFPGRHNGKESPANAVQMQELQVWSLVVENDNTF